ncbi:MAG: SUMF1/EgtB/PvdO family nonheme iron enzyme [Phycisphaerales bacterium]
MRHGRLFVWLASAALWLVAIAAPTPSAFAQGCSGDVNGDGVVDAIDLGIVLGDWGTCPGTIESVSPLQGSSLGGTLITISGTTLAGTTAVTVGGAPCTNVTVLSPTKVTAVTPPGRPGPAAIAVTTRSGPILAPMPFTYLQSSITSVVPNMGAYSGGTAITITGTSLAGATSVTVGGVPATNVVAVSDTTVTAVTPPGSLGAVDVTVSSPSGTETASGAFTYVGIVVPSWATLLEAAPDPAVVTDPSLRAAIIASGRAWRVRDNGTNIEMLLVVPGTFNMGCSPSNQNACNADENPVHAVTLTNAFYLGQYEVTQAQWTAAMGSNPSAFQGPNRPVEKVSWNMVQGFLTATGMRLPSEAEWEYACRAGTATAFHSMCQAPNGTSDNALVPNIAWCNANSGLQTHVVGGKEANGLGLHDMSGNVWEWVNDWYSDTYYSVSPAVDPPGPATGDLRVMRGGAFNFNPGDARSSVRFVALPDNAFGFAGFRVARAP